LAHQHRNLLGITIALAVILTSLIIFIAH
jgi:hypothetical protein